jgi:hypothetical protein
LSNPRLKHLNEFRVFQHLAPLNLPQFNFLFFALKHGSQQILEVLHLQPESLIFGPYLLIDGDLVDDLPVHQPDIFGIVLHDGDVAVLDGAHQACQQHHLGLNSFNALLHLFLLRLELLEEGGFLLLHLLLLGRSRDRHGGLSTTDLVRQLLDPLLDGSQLQPIEGLLVLLGEIDEDLAPR